MNRKRTLLYAAAALLVVALSIIAARARPQVTTWPGFKPNTGTAPQSELKFKDDRDFGYRTGEIVPVTVYVKAPAGTELEPDSLTVKGDMEIARRSVFTQKGEDDSVYARFELGLQSFVGMPKWTATPSLTYRAPGGNKNETVDLATIEVYTSKTFDDRKPKDAHPKEPEVSLLYGHHTVVTVSLLVFGILGSIACLLLLFSGRRRKATAQTTSEETPEPVLDPKEQLNQVMTRLFEGDQRDETVLAAVLQLRAFYKVQTATTSDLLGSPSPFDAALGEALEILETSRVWGDGILPPDRMRRLAQAWAQLNMDPYKEPSINNNDDHSDGDDSDGNLGDDANRERTLPACTDSAGGGDNANANSNAGAHDSAANTPVDPVDPAEPTSHASMERRAGGGWGTLGLVLMTLVMMEVCGTFAGMLLVDPYRWLIAHFPVIRTEPMLVEQSFTMLMYLGKFLGVIAFLKLTVGREERLSALTGYGKSARRSWEQVSKAVALGFAGFVLSLLTTWVLYNWVFRLPPEVMAHAVPHAPHAASAPSGSPLGIGLAYLVDFNTKCVLAPVLEEIVFRGFIFAMLLSVFSRGKRTWQRCLGEIAALVISGFLFSIMHFNLAGFIPLMVMGFYMALVYRLSRNNLYAPIAMHVFNNVNATLL
jgi:membrane protease YdiL (CAAX protease family)